MSPAFLVDYGVHNDYRIGNRAIVGDLSFGHIESYHLVRVGRILNAYLYNLHWKQVRSYTDLKLWRLVSASLLVASFIAVALHLCQSTMLPDRRAIFLALALFFAPPFTINVYYASLLVPGTLAIALAVGIYVAHWHLLGAALNAPSPRWKLGIWLTATITALTVGHFIYTPSTLIFLVLAAIHLLFRRASSQSRTTAVLELGAYILSCFLYFVLQRKIVLPWASRAFVYGSHWTDPHYRFAVSMLPGQQDVDFLRDAASVSLNAWNAFESFNAAWIFAPLLMVATLRRARAGGDPGRTRRGIFVAGFFVACFSLSVGPALLSPFPLGTVSGPVGPGLSRLCRMRMGRVRGAPAGRLRRLHTPRRLFLAAGSVLLASVTFATMATAVQEARAEVECLQRFVLEAPQVDALLLLSDESETALRLEFGYRIGDWGPLGDFAFQVTRDLMSHGQLTSEQEALLRSVRTVSPEEAVRWRGAQRTAVLNVSAPTCPCVAGAPCEVLRSTE